MRMVTEWSRQITDSVETVFFGKHAVIEKLLVALLCRGHVLLEDVPGVGKTILARALASSLGGEFSRIQCTPDLLPADILGVSVYNPNNGSFAFREGPIMANIVLVDEINRATPRTQSALLEATGEGQVSIEGKQRKLPEPFFLIATENPIDFEGTFPLPEAQKDRFLLSLTVGYPERETEQRIVESQRRLTHPVNDLSAVTDLSSVPALQEQVVSVHVEQSVMDYMSALIEASRSHQHVRIGVSPRGTLALYKASQALAAVRGRDYVVPEDVKELCRPVFEKRLIMASQAV
ncbi:MAG: MoxR family ATPase, partial [Spirochaetaceae bacterium]|nr:MoxR family ATPase [Spirochaetaceae bacterium]